MADKPLFHIGPQQAQALLGPMRTTMRELDSRSQHYLERLRLADDERERIEAAQRALAQARAEIERLYDEAIQAQTG